MLQPILSGLAMPPVLPAMPLVLLVLLQVLLAMPRVLLVLPQVLPAMPLVLLVMQLQLVLLAPPAMPHRPPPLAKVQAQLQEKAQLVQAQARGVNKDKDREVAKRVVVACVWVTVNPALGVTTKLRNSREGVGHCGMLLYDFVLVIVSVDAVY